MTVTWLELKESWSVQCVHSTLYKTVCKTAVGSTKPIFQGLVEGRNTSCQNDHIKHVHANSYQKTVWNRFLHYTCDERLMMHSHTTHTKACVHVHIKVRLFPVMSSRWHCPPSTVYSHGAQCQRCILCNKWIAFCFIDVYRHTDTQSSSVQMQLINQTPLLFVGPQSWTSLNSRVCWLQKLLCVQ